MGLDSKRPPLPAPTEPTDNDTDVGTTLSRRTDQTSYSVPEDGSPITISTHKLTCSESPRLRHGRNKSQTSLLIEYFEAGKGDKAKSRPSVRVKVTPSSHRKQKSSSSSSDAVQITGIGRDRKPSYTRRISLGNRNTAAAAAATTITALEGTEVSHSSESNLSARPPVEVEILNGSEVSAKSRDLHYLPTTSDVSSMPPDSLVGASQLSQQSEAVSEDAGQSADHDAYLDAPAGDGARSASHERIKQRVMEKLLQRQRGEPVEYEPDTKPPKERRRRSSRSAREEDVVSAAESSILSSNLSHLSPSNASYLSGTSKVSLSNPKLLQMVEDTVRRLILPEITQLKNEQRRASDHSYTESDLSRRHSKSSSSQNTAAKPRVVLNRSEDDPGELLSRGDSERREPPRRSSHAGSEGSGRRRSSHTSAREESVKSKSSRDSHRVRDAAAAAGLAAGLTAEALRHHNSPETASRERRKKRRSRESRSASHSMAETDKSYRRQDIPPMPWTGPAASGINDSEVTRESILSAATERPRPSSAHAEPETPVREVPRGSLAESLSPASTTPRGPRSPRTLESAQSRRTITQERPTSSQSVHSISTKARVAALAAAGLGGAATPHKTERERTASPAQSASALGDGFDDPLVPPGLRPRSRVSELSAGFEERQRNALSPQSAASPPAARHTGKSSDLRRSTDSANLGYEEDDTETPHELEEWFQREHEKNEQYRQSLAESSAAPESLDGRRTTQYTEGSYESSELSAEHDVRGVAATPQYMQVVPGVESAVASLIDPSMVSSSVQSSQTGPGKAEGEYHRQRMDGHAREEPEVQSPVQSRWSAIRENAMAMSNRGSSGHPSDSNSPPHQSGGQPLGGEQSRLQSPSVHLGASGIPDVNDPMPEIGHGIDSESDLSTNPPEIQGPGRVNEHGDARFAFQPPHSPIHNDRDSERRDSISEHSYKMTDALLLGAGAAADRALRQKSPAEQTAVEEYASRETTPDVRQAEAVHYNRGESSPAAQFRDEGYSSAAYARSAGAATPKANAPYTEDQLADYDAAMGRDDPFVGKHKRHMSANSHGMSSPLYDSATGRGIDNIQSKDVVALMDHLTVRDAQRNARDTEILVTLVRSAAEMRQNFEDMKRYIAEQDRKIMENTDRDAEYTVKKVLGGPRPQPPSTPRTAHSAYGDEPPAKRKNVFKRALKGLGKRSSHDLSKIEDMLNTLLGDVEDLKLTQGGERPLSLRGSSFDSYEDRPHYGRDSGYEPDGQAGTSSTPNQSGHLSNQSGNLSFHSPQENVSSPKDRWFHSGYDGRRDSINRVSTVMEEDSNDGSSILEQHETHILSNQFENNERLLTPTQERFNRQSASSEFTASPHRRHHSPYQNKYSPSDTPDKQPKSNNSSSFAAPKMSRWSKTTTSSSAPDNYEAKRRSQYSDASRSGDSLGSAGGYFGNGYALKSDDRLRSTQSLAKEDDAKEPHYDGRSVRSARSDVTRTPSPLIPSDAGSQISEPHAASPLGELDEFDDPKYQAHRNSLLLQHPQPRQGPTHRHQTTLEKEARTFSGPDHFENGTDSDLSQRTNESDFDPLQWGSNPTLSLARTNKIGGVGAARDDGPLVPQSKPAPPKVELEPAREDRKQAQQKGPSQRPLYYSAPLGSGHLLEPIEEVRYSLETDSGHRSPDPSASPRSVNRPSPARKITGPRPMHQRSPSATATEEPEQRSGTVRRKPVPAAKSYDSKDGRGTWDRDER